jgi:two-component system, LuxR family, sensor kinase FixL
MMRDAMDKAAEQALRAGQIIRRLRDFVARGESERRMESIAKLVEEASALAPVRIKDQGVRVRFQFDPTVDHVLVDKVQIQQVLLNLMRNAVEAMYQSPKRELVISTARADDDMIAVAVADTGIFHHEASRYGHGLVHLQDPRRIARRPDLGGCQARRRYDL